MIFFYTPDQWRANSWIRMFLSVCSFQSCADVYLTLKAFQSMTELEKLRMLLRKVSGRLESNRTVKIEANSALQDLIILHIIQKPNRIIVFNEWKKKLSLFTQFFTNHSSFKYFFVFFLVTYLTSLARLATATCICERNCFLMSSPLKKSWCWCYVQ